MFETKKTFYLIVDTCTWHLCSPLIGNMTWFIDEKELNFVVVVPTIVIRELKTHEIYNNPHKLDIYRCWAQVPKYKMGTTNLGKSAEGIFNFFRVCSMLDVKSLRLQGIHETKNYPIKIADDFDSGLFTYYHEKYNGNVALLSHDWELCCKARVFKMNALSRHDHDLWRELLQACQCELPVGPFKPPKPQSYRLTKEQEQELLYRPMVECDCEPLSMFSM